MLGNTINHACMHCGMRRKQLLPATAVLHVNNQMAPHLGSGATDRREGERLGHEALHQVRRRLAAAQVQLLIQARIEHLPLQIQRRKEALLRRVLLQQGQGCKLKQRRRMEPLTFCPHKRAPNMHGRLLLYWSCCTAQRTIYASAPRIRNLLRGTQQGSAAEKPAVNTDALGATHLQGGSLGVMIVKDARVLHEVLKQL
jgi:hypothetical protein